MSPTPNYYPQETKLSEIEGKTFGDCQIICLSVWIWLTRI